MGDFRVELHGVYRALFVPHGRAGALRRARDRPEAVRHGCDAVGMAHPAHALFRDAFEQGIALRAEHGLSVFGGAFRAFDAAAREVCDELRAVADPEHGDAASQHRAFAAGGSFGVHAVRPAGEDHAFVAARGYVAGADGAVRGDLRVYPEVADPARDQLVVLPAEIQDEYLFHMGSFHTSICGSAPACARRGRSFSRYLSVCSALRPAYRQGSSRARSSPSPRRSPG